MHEPCRRRRRTARSLARRPTRTARSSVPPSFGSLVAIDAIVLWPQDTAHSRALRSSVTLTHSASRVRRRLEPASARASSSLRSWYGHFRGTPLRRASISRPLSSTATMLASHQHDGADTAAFTADNQSAQPSAKCSSMAQDIVCRQLSLEVVSGCFRPRSTMLSRRHTWFGRESRQGRRRSRRVQAQPMRSSVNHTSPQHSEPSIGHLIQFFSRCVPFPPEPSGGGGSGVSLTTSPTRCEI